MTACCCLQVKVHFNADEALTELRRLGQLQQVSGQSDKGDLRDGEFTAIPFRDGYAKLKGHWNDLLLRPDGEVVGASGTA